MTDASGEPSAMKTCTRCGETKPETAFHRDGKNGRNPKCAQCRSEVRRIEGRRDKPRVKDPKQVLKGRLWRFYKLTLDQFAQLRDAQGGVCAICGNPPPDGMRLYVDHCHSTGVVRALLCTRCNLAVGIYEHHHRAVADYLATYGHGNPLLPPDHNYARS